MHLSQYDIKPKIKFQYYVILQHLEKQAGTEMTSTKQPYQQMCWVYFPFIPEQWDLVSCRPRSIQINHFLLPSSQGCFFALLLPILPPLPLLTHSVKKSSLFRVVQKYIFLTYSNGCMICTICSQCHLLGVRCQIFSHPHNLAPNVGITSS